MKKLLSFLLVLLLVFSLVACSSETEKTASSQPDSFVTSSTSSDDIVRDPKTDGATPLLYKISDKNGNYCYLFGSVHVGEDWMYPLPDYVLEAFNESTALALEVDVTKYEKDTEHATNSLLAYVYRDGTTIRDHISEELYNEAVAIMKDTVFASMLPTLEYIMPAFWEQIITQTYYESLGFDFQKGVDRHLVKLAKEANKPIYDVEDALEHATFQAKFSEELQELILKDAVESYKADSEELLTAVEELITAWALGEPDLLIPLLKESKFENAEEERLYEEYNEAVLTVRDRIMADYIMDVIKRGEKVFVTVGAAHIVGDESVSGMLKNAGYTVEIVK